MNTHNPENHTYLGDGLYAESTPMHIILRANDHRDNFCTDKVYLEKGILLSFIAWLVEIKRTKNDSIIKDFPLEKFFKQLGHKCDEIAIDAALKDTYDCHLDKGYAEAGEVFLKCEVCGYMYWGKEVS
jgi:hypothetical protein